VVRPWMSGAPGGGGDRETVSGDGRPVGSVADPIVGERAEVARRWAPLVLSRKLHEAMRNLEARLESGSILRRTLLPPVQLALSSTLGLGNEQAYPGRDGWLFYRADVDHLTGPPFLDPSVLRRRAQAGDSWSLPPQPDPLPALTDLADELSELGISLVVMPTPLKPMIYPDRLSPRVGSPRQPLRSPSYDRLVAELQTRGITVFDAAPAVLQLRAEGTESYLEADTHWTPSAVERVAVELAALLRPLVGPTPEIGIQYFRRSVVVQGSGDIARMLRLPEGQTLYPPRHVEAQMVLDESGRLWRPARDAQVLLLGDSFTNVFSEPALGWGAGAGLAEQLSVELGRPVDRLALNAGGAVAVRQALRRELRRDPSRFAATRVVIYQFAARELSQGDWRAVSLSSDR